MDERDRSQQRPPPRDEGARHAEPGTGAGVDYEDARGDMRYVGGGRTGGQNYSSEGFGANQSYSAGPGYQQAEPQANLVSPEDAPAPTMDYAVEPGDLGVKDYDLQGSYGRPAEDAKSANERSAPPARDRR